MNHVAVTRGQNCSLRYRFYYLKWGVDTVERVIYFDGICNLCNSAVQFIIRHDPTGTFKFAPHKDERDTLIYVEHGVVYTQSDAVLRIGMALEPRTLRLMARVALMVPRPLRDYVYRQVAQHRYRWFGKRERCMIPTPEVRNRFVEYEQM